MSAALTDHTFQDSWYKFLKDLGLTDVSSEYGGYTRVAFQGNQAQWDMVHEKMTALRETQQGSEKGSTTAAMGRIMTTAKQARLDAWRKENLKARAARRAFRAASNSKVGF